MLSSLFVLQKMTLKDVVIVYCGTLYGSNVVKVSKVSSLMITEWVLWVTLGLNLTPYSTSVPFWLQDSRRDFWLRSVLHIMVVLTIRDSETFHFTTLVDFLWSTIIFVLYTVVFILNPLRRFSYYCFSWGKNPVS